MNDMPELKVGDVAHYKTWTKALLVEDYPGHHRACTSVELISRLEGADSWLVYSHACYAVLSPSVLGDIGTIERDGKVIWEREEVCELRADGFADEFNADLYEYWESNYRGKIDQLKAELAALREQLRWREWPDEKYLGTDECLIAVESPRQDHPQRIYIGGSCHDKWTVGEAIVTNVTHWRPVGDLPEEGC